MKIQFSIITLFIFTLFSCENENSDSNELDPAEEVQIELGKTNQTVEHNGVTRSYVQYVPNSYNHENPTPLIINFHGNGGDAQATLILLVIFINFIMSLNQENLLLFILKE